MRKPFLILLIVLLLSTIVFVSIFLRRLRSKNFWHRFTRDKIKDVRFGVNHLVEEYSNNISSSGVGWVSMSPVVVWGIVEPSRGVYNWKSVDAIVKKIQSLDLEPTFTIMPVSPWATPWSFSRYKRGLLGVCDYPNDIEAWKNFLKAMAERYDYDGIDDMEGLKAPVKNWHILEEWPTFWYDRGDSSPENPENAKRYVNLLKASSEAIKEVMPDAKIILCGFASDKLRLIAYVDGFINDPDGGIFHGINYTREQLENSREFRQLKADVNYILEKGRDYFDIVDLHLQDAKICFTEGKIRWILDKMRSFGYSKPIWVVEAGGPFKRLMGDTTSRAGDSLFGYFTRKEHAEFVIKMHVLSYALGVERFQWNWIAKENSFWDGPFLLIPLLATSGKPTPAYYTYFILQYYMNGFDSIEEIYVRDNVRFFKIYVGGKVIYVAWSNAEVTIDLSAFIDSSNVKIIHIVTRVDSKNNPIMVKDNIVNVNKVKLSTTPVFIEKI